MRQPVRANPLMSCRVPRSPAMLEAVTQAHSVWQNSLSDTSTLAPADSPHNLTRTGTGIKLRPFAGD